MREITPCLWFDGAAEEAANFYVSLLPGSRVDKVTRSPIDYPSGRAGDVLTVDFTLAGRPFIGLNGGSQFRFTEAISLSSPCEDQAEIDRLWDALTADGGEPGPCGWLKDKWGLSWQVFPKILPELLADPDRARAGRAMKSMMTMGKIDLAEIRRAADGADQVAST
jgi:predicted 3-demethylubiquinone-9 3-methyltransferase (glyoxalase superfamily)